MKTDKEIPSNSADEIFKRLSEQAVDERFLQREDELFQRHVSAFASLLQDDVTQALQNEPANEVSKEFVGAANALLRQLRHEDTARGEDVPVDKPLGEETITETIRREIAEELRSGIVPPDQQEIESHARELGQCVLSNWFALLQKAKLLRTKHARPIPLNSNALPLSVFATGLMFEGVEAFALDLDIVERRFEQFLTILAEPSRFQQMIAALLRKPHYEVIELAPDLVLVAQTHQKWFLTGSVGEAKNFIQAEDVAPDSSQFGDPVWAIDGVCAFAWPSSKPQWDRQLLTGVIRMAANNAIRQQAQSGTVALLDLGVERFEKEYTNLLRHVTRLTSKTIEQALDPGQTSSSVEIFREIRECVSDIRETVEVEPLLLNVPTMEVCQAVIATAICAVAESTRIGIGKKLLSDESTEYHVLNQPEARLVMNIATRTAKDVLNSPQIRIHLHI